VVITIFQEQSVLTNKNKFSGWIAGCLILTSMLAGCEQANTFVVPPPPKVTVAQPLMEEVIDSLEFTGTTVASAQVEVRARVSGVLQSMHFEPGTPVEQGDLLFVIDPKEYEADLQAAEAELAAAEAQLERAETEYVRAEKLFKKKAGTEMDVVKWRGERAVASASIHRAQAKIDRARLNLGYTQVVAPISGRVGRNKVDVGNLVGEGEATVLTEITKYDPMYAYFNLNELDLLRVMTMYRQRVKEKGIDPETHPDSEAEIKVFLGLVDEEGYPHEGVLDFGESGVDPDTGTVQLRGIFENSQKPVVLFPGLFARVRLPIAKRQNLPLVSERALGADQSGQYLLAVNSENVVEKRNVRLGQLIDGMRVIEEGLKNADWVVINGIQRARPGAKVDPEKTDMASLKVSAMRQATQAADNKASTPDSSESGQKAQ
jgi:RND family efflux transporter MFP subunit